MLDSLLNVKAEGASTTNARQQQPAAPAMKPAPAAAPFVAPAPPPPAFLANVFPNSSTLPYGAVTHANASAYAAHASQMMDGRTKRVKKVRKREREEKEQICHASQRKEKKRKPCAALLACQCCHRAWAPLSRALFPVRALHATCSRESARERSRKAAARPSRGDEKRWSWKARGTKGFKVFDLTNLRRRFFFFDLTLFLPCYSPLHSSFPNNSPPRRSRRRSSASRSAAGEFFICVCMREREETHSRQLFLRAPPSFSFFSLTASSSSSSPLSSLSSSSSPLHPHPHNSESAQRSRARKSLFVKSLEVENRELKRELFRLRAVVEAALAGGHALHPSALVPPASFAAAAGAAAAGAAAYFADEHDDEDDDEGEESNGGDKDECGASNAAALSLSRSTGNLSGGGSPISTDC